MAEASVYSLALLSYPLPEHSSAQVTVHCMCALFAHAPCFLSLWWSLTAPLEVELCMQQALCCLLLCVHFPHATSHDYNRMPLQPSKQFHITALWCWIWHYSPCSALHCVMSHAILIQTTCRAYIHQVGVSSMWDICSDHSVLPKWSWSFGTPYQTCLMCGGVSGCVGIFSAALALLFPRSTYGPGSHIIIHSCRTILVPCL